MQNLIHNIRCKPKTLWRFFYTFILCSTQWLNKILASKRSTGTFGKTSTRVKVRKGNLRVMWNYCSHWSLNGKFWEKDIRGQGLKGKLQHDTALPLESLHGSNVHSRFFGKSSRCRLAGWSTACPLLTLEIHLLYGLTMSSATHLNSACSRNFPGNIGRGNWSLPLYVVFLLMLKPHHVVHYAVRWENLF